MPPPDRPRLPLDRKPAKLETLDRPPMLDRTVQAQIGRMLREHFSGVAGESVPDRFITLLAELEAKEKSR
jgi:anti-sigma factor NepR-like protein